MGIKYDTGVLYDSGALYVGDELLVNYYRAAPHSLEAEEQSFDLMRHVQLRLKHRGGFLLVQSLRVLAKRGRHTLPVYRVPIHARGFQRVSVIIRHHGGFFHLYELRAHAKPTRRRILG